MQRIGIKVILIFAICSFANAAEVFMDAPAYADAGEVIQITLFGADFKEISVSLLNLRNKTLSRSEGFRWTSPAGDVFQLALLGIPTTTSPGRYRLSLNASGGRVSWELEKYLSVREVQYTEKIITLTESMNSLYTDKSERKKREAREFWDLISTFDTDAVHHSGVFLPPLNSQFITSEFGERRRFRMPDGSESSSIHFGRDFRGKIGTPVFAPGYGRVVMATERLLTGYTVILEHLPGFYTLYYHLDSISVQLGQMVFQGKTIGTVGNTGFSTGAHLHWEIRVGGVPVSPQQFMNDGLLDTKALISKIN